ncbi:hypothetical protein ACTU45_31590 [Streptomyces sp. 24-1644]|uniref:hypothetical protein n=1 Tax=Streptomyces sp. 24-1644 TaxID=3457315 RepID=UPI003FA79EFD
MAQVHIRRHDRQTAIVDDGVRHPIRVRNPHPLNSHSSPPCVDDTTAPGVLNGPSVVPTSTTKTSKTARSELFITWPWRGWVLLHAGRQIDRSAMSLPLVRRTVRGGELVTGAVLGIARLVDCHQDPPGSPPCTEWAQTDAWHLVLDDVQELALPFPARGQLVPWKLADGVVAQVLQQLPNLRP